MKQRLLALVVCPLCGDDLRCDPDDVDRADAEEIMEAELSCARGHRYPVINGVPRLLAPELLADTLRQFHAQHFRRYRAYWENTPSAKSSTEGRTLRSFSYQWNVFSEMYAHWEENFWSYFEPLVKRDDFAGKLVLDAGCGFGRHAFYAAKLGAEVLAMDLSEGVEAAYENTRSLDNVHVVQADLYRAPLRPIFDRSTASVSYSTSRDRRRASADSPRSYERPGACLSGFTGSDRDFIGAWICSGWSARDSPCGGCTASPSF